MDMYNNLLTHPLRISVWLCLRAFVRNRENEKDITTGRQAVKSMRVRISRPGGISLSTGNYHDTGRENEIKQTNIENVFFHAFFWTLDCYIANTYFSSLTLVIFFILFTNLPFFMLIFFLLFCFILNSVFFLFAFFFIIVTKLSYTFTLIFRFIVVRPSANYKKRFSLHDRTTLVRILIMPWVFKPLLINPRSFLL